jgi:spore maturation protein CgeB
MSRQLVVFGLSISSSWGNGHAPTFRGLLRALAERGWATTFFERDAEWYSSNRDLPEPEFCELRLYADWPSARAAAASAVAAADAVLVGSLVPDGPAIIDWLATTHRPLLFYDIDTPNTLVQFAERGRCDYLRVDQVRLFSIYLSFAGGPALIELERVWGSPHAEALYCGVDTQVYRPVTTDPRFVCDLGYMGTYSADRQAAVEELLFGPARLLPERRFMLAGPQYPAMQLPPNVRHEIHLYPRDHAAFYVSNWSTLNLTRQAMRHYGWAPSTRLFEAAACGACIISDPWPGLDSLLQPNTEVLLASTCMDVVEILRALTPERRASIGAAARRRILAEHTYAQRAAQLETALERAIAQRPALIRQAHHERAAIVGHA